MADNSVLIVGNVTRDPELQQTNSGQSVARFGLAVSRRWQNRQTNEWDEATSFFDVTCWAQLADNVAQSVTKGARVMVSGRLEQNSWENRDGAKRSSIEIVADEVGASMRWATVGIERNERRGPDQQGNGRAHSKAGAPSGGYQNPDEEPF